MVSQIDVKAIKTLIDQVSDSENDVKGQQVDIWCEKESYRRYEATRR
jgi:hypothetical protein